MTFNETQKFAPGILWYMRVQLVVMAILFIFLSLKFPESRIILLPTYLLIIVPISLLLELVRLKVTVNADGIDMSFKPFTKKNFSWDEIASAAVVNYGFVGGWGIRVGTKYGTVYNTQGSEGLGIKLKNGKKLVIGTQRKAAMQSAVNKFTRP